MSSGTGICAQCFGLFSTTHVRVTLPCTHTICGRCFCVDGPIYITCRTCTEGFAKPWETLPLPPDRCRRALLLPP